MSQSLEKQYKDSRNLARRANIHHKYGRGDWWAFVKGLLAWPEGASVLDAGCGAGWFWRDPTPMPRLDITLLDQSAGMVAEAEKNTAIGQPAAQLRGVVGDVAALPFADDSFDIVLAIHMLYHLPDPARGVAELARVLRPGGTAVVTTNGLHNFAETETLSRKIWGSCPGRDLAQHFGLETGAPVLNAAFDAVELHPFDDRLACEDAEDVIAYVRSFPPGNTATAEELQKLTTAIADTFSQNGGVYPITKRTGAFVCRRKLEH